MIPHQPLKTNPEFSVRAYPGYHEYRIENWRLARDGSGRVINGASGFGWPDAFAFIIASIFLKWKNQWWSCFTVGAVLLVRLWFKCTQVLSESVILLPPHGVQLETRRGLPAICLSTARRFLPLATLQDVIINEGIKGWNVNYYLVAVRYTNTGGFSLSVAFENILPPHTVLLHVYYEAHKQLLRG